MRLPLSLFSTGRQLLRVHTFTSQTMYKHYKDHTLSNPARRKICIIGAGLCGLVMLKYLRQHPELFDVTVYEMTPHIGGMWVYTDRVGTDEEGFPIHTSMYKHLKANFPKQVLELDDYPIPTEWPSYLTHREYLEYLQNFTTNFHLKENIQFKTKVLNVSPTKLLSGLTKWNVSTKNLSTMQESVTEYCSVIVCNGQYSIPFYPEIPGLETYPGTIIHSHEYRVPEVFEGKNVLVIGGSFSGQEITTQLLKYASRVCLSHPCNNPIKSISTEIQQLPVIEKIDGMNITLQDNTELTDIDVLLFCTGYRKDFSFLDGTCCPSYRDLKVTPLYQQIIHVEYPSLYFLGVVQGVPVPLCATVQAQFVYAHMRGVFALPKKEDMYKHIHEMFKKIAEHKGPPRTYWDYYDELADMGGFKHLPKVTEKILEVAWERLSLNICKARDVNFITKNSKEFEQVPIERDSTQDFWEESKRQLDTQDDQTCSIKVQRTSNEFDDTIAQLTRDFEELEVEMLNMDDGMMPMVKKSRESQQSLHSQPSAKLALLEGGNNASHDALLKRGSDTSQEAFPKTGSQALLNTAPTATPQRLSNASQDALLKSESKRGSDATDGAPLPKTERLSNASQDATPKPESKRGSNVSQGAASPKVERLSNASQDAALPKTERLSNASQDPMPKPESKRGSNASQGGPSAINESEASPNKTGRGSDASQSASTKRGSNPSKKSLTKNEDDS